MTVLPVRPVAANVLELGLGPRKKQYKTQND